MAQKKKAEKAEAAKLAKAAQEEACMHDRTHDVYVFTGGGVDRHMQYNMICLRCRPPQQAITKLDTIEAKAESKRKEAEDRLEKKHKDDGKVLLNLLSVPLAKFEIDVATLRGCQPSNPFLPSLTELFNTGIQYKTQATETMNTGGDLPITKDKVKQWINTIRAQGKRAQAMIKASA